MSATRWDGQISGDIIVMWLSKIPQFLIMFIIVVDTFINENEDGVPTQVIQLLPLASMHIDLLRQCAK